MGSPPLRARMSGAVLRLIAACTDMSGPDDGNADHGGMKGKAQRERGAAAAPGRDQVIGRPAHRDWRPAGVLASLQRDAVEYRPGQERAEQDDRPEIAIREQTGPL